ncbi:MAG TPA: hypothetical protein VFW47_00420, partial [Phenylobacterium sp.]|nr:hypothetical protein [Phenylobacterium sp.]
NFVDVHNLGDGYTVLASTADGFQRILAENAGTGNQGFDISGVRIEQFDAGSPVSMSFNVAVTDGDLDQAFGTIGVSLTPPDFIL